MFAGDGAFQYQCSTGANGADRQLKPAFGTAHFDDDVKQPRLPLFQKNGLNTSALNDFELLLVLTERRHARSGEPQNLCVKVAELAVALNENFVAGTELHLLEDLESRGERFGENRFFVRDAIRHDVKIRNRNRSKLRES